MEPGRDRTGWTRAAGVEFEGKAKTFVGGYGLLAAILPDGHPAWEKLSNFLIPKLPAREENLSKGVLEAIDMDSHRTRAQAAMRMATDDAGAFVEPPPPAGGRIDVRRADRHDAS